VGIVGTTRQSSSTKNVKIKRKHSLTNRKQSKANENPKHIDCLFLLTGSGRTIPLNKCAFGVYPQQGFFAGGLGGFSPTMIVVPLGTAVV
jgi:hypothetical protein